MGVLLLWLYLIIYDENLNLFLFQSSTVKDATSIGKKIMRISIKFVKIPGTFLVEYQLK